MHRFIIDELESWSKKPTRLPLALYGARQVGKTYALKAFGQKCFEHYHYINFESERDVHKIFENNLDVTRIVSELELKLNSKIEAKRDLVIFDEIQECPNALTAIKYFAENLPELHLCMAGSLLGLNFSEASFPVGKIQRVWMGPMTFEEYLLGTQAHREHESLLRLIEGTQTSDFVHSVLWEKFKIYLALGGLPRVIDNYNTHRDNLVALFETSREIQLNLVKDYLADISKHAGKENANHVQAVFNSIPSQLGQNIDEGAKRYKFKDVLPGSSRYSRLEGPIDWLIKAGVIYKVKICNQAELPLESFTKESIFRLYFFDTGLLGALAGLPMERIYNEDYGQTKGVFAENIVLQSLIKSELHNVYSWQKNQAEIEFMTLINGAVTPIEVKASHRTQSKSLASFKKSYSPYQSIIVSKNPLRWSNRSRTLYVPTYLSAHIPKLTRLITHDV